MHTFCIQLNILVLTGSAAAAVEGLGADTVDVNAFYVSDHGVHQTGVVQHWASCLLIYMGNNIRVTEQ